jgi:Na+-translocating ferredoxin:NAD+ oxidoreductase RnfG subunit
MWQILISAAATFLLGILTILIKSRFDQKKTFEENQSKRLNAVLKYQEDHMNETKEMNQSFNKMQSELILNRVDSQCAIYALRKASNGIKFSEYIDEKRDELMAEYNFRFKNKEVS